MSDDMRHENDPARPPPGGLSRRTALLALGAGLATLAGAILALPVVGPLLSSAWRFVGRRKWVSVGAVDTFPEGSTRLAHYRNPLTVPWDGETARIPCWVRRVAGTEFHVFSVHCTHLGCPVRWFAESGLFLCPCHGGVFYADGRRAAGPPPRDLYRYPHRIRGGRLQVLGGELPTLAEPL